MTIDISKIRPGDRVTLVPLEVDRFSPLGIMVSLPGGVLYSIAANQIAAHHPAPREFQIGDRVKALGQAATVRFVDEREAWLRFDGEEYNQTWDLSDLTLVEDGE